jgi:hypothetical protein
MGIRADGTSVDSRAGIPQNTNCRLTRTRACRQSLGRLEVARLPRQTAEHNCVASQIQRM